MPLKLITGPTAEPVTLAEAKLHLKVEVADDDTLITSMIAAARGDAEHRLGRSLITQTWEQVLDAFDDAIKLPNPPILSIVSIKYIDQDGAEQTLSSGAYTLDLDNEPGFVEPVYGTEWPATRVQTNAVRVRYTAGYGTTGASVPAQIKAWILLRVGALYENREGVQIGQAMQAAPRDFADGLLDRYKVYA